MLKSKSRLLPKLWTKNIVHEVIIDITNTSVMDETLKVPKTTPIDEFIHQEKEHASKHFATSNKATSRRRCT